MIKKGLKATEIVYLDGKRNAGRWQSNTGSEIKLYPKSQPVVSETREGKE